MPVINRTFSPKASEISREWWLVDAKDLILGRMSTQIARILQGKHKPSYTAHLDSGDYIVVVNAEKIILTGNKEDQKIIYRHSGYPGGLKKKPYTENPREALRRTIKGMLPKTKLGRQMLKKLMIYEGAEHPHIAQSPKPLEILTGKEEGKEESKAASKAAGNG